MISAGIIGPPPKAVVLVGGVFTRTHSLDDLAGALKDHGFDVSIAHTGGYGLKSIDTDARTVAHVVESASDRSIATGGSRRVSLVGHSKGGISARWYLQRLGGIAHVDQLITLGSPNQGTLPVGVRLSKLAAQLPGMPPVRELVTGGPVMNGLRDELPDFLNAARRSSPNFRMVSIAGDVDKPGMRGTDGLITTWEAAFNAAPSMVADARHGARMLIPGTEDHVIAGMHHGALVGTLGDIQPVLPLLTSKLSRTS